MTDDFFREEEVAAPDLKLDFFFEGLAVVSAGYHCPLCRLANPEWVNDIVNEAKFVTNPEDGEPVINGFDLIDPNVVVVISVL